MKNGEPSEENRRGRRKAEKEGNAGKRRTYGEGRGKEGKKKDCRLEFCHW